MSQLPFGFCLTFYMTADLESVIAALAGLNCLSAFVSLSTAQMDFDEYQKTAVGLNCLSAFVSLSTLGAAAAPVAPAVPGLNCLSAFVSLSTPVQMCLRGKPLHQASQLPFGFCLTFYDRNCCSNRDFCRRGSQLPFGFCLTFYRSVTTLKQ